MTAPARVVTVPQALCTTTEIVLGRWAKADIEEALTPDEVRRSAAFKFAHDRDDYVAAHLLVREAAALFTGDESRTLRLGHRCPDCASADHGVPKILERPLVNVSLSHARGVVAAMSGAGRLGIDVDNLLRDLSPSDELIRSTMAPAEEAAIVASADISAAFLRQWVRKEALVKAGVLSIGALADADLSELQQGTVDDNLDEDGSKADHLRWGEWHLVERSWKGHAVTAASLGAPARLADY